MSDHGNAQFRVSKRCLLACARCRSMKVRCSGTFPCTRCERKKKPCQFDGENGRTSVPESQLRDVDQRFFTSPASSSRPADSVISDSRALRAGSSHTFPNTSPAEHSRAGVVESIPNNSPPRHLDSDDDQGDDSRSSQGQRGPQSDFSRNPLVDEEFVLAPDGKYWFMGPTSSWAFCRRVLALIGRKIPEASQIPDPWNLDGIAFQLNWTPLGRNEMPDVSDIPPLDYALFLFNTAKYCLGPLFQIIDEESFHRDLHRFYEDPASVASNCRFWYAQYLLLLAFGKAFVHFGSPSSPAGSKYASRAMALLPDQSGLRSDPLRAIEVLCLAALYFQCIDMRLAAFQHIGQALRLCIIEGIHRHMPPEAVGAELSQRCNTIFWTVYVLDRQFSAMIGSPSSISDNDITTKLPSKISQTLDAECSTLQIRISRLTAKILTTVYGVGKNFDGSLIKNTQSILHNLADLSGSLGQLLKNRFQGSVNRASKTVTRLVLSYHHCVVLTTRPLVMCLLQKRLTHPESQTDEDSTPSNTVTSLLQSCIDSALNVLRILRALGDDDLLGERPPQVADLKDPSAYRPSETFLPFQLEDTFSSAFLLYIIQAVSPELIEDDSWAANAHEILDRMIARGNVAAPLRKLELKHLEYIMISLAQSGTPAEGVPRNMPHGVEDLRAAESMMGLTQPPDDGMQAGSVDGLAYDETLWDLLGTSGAFALSAQELSCLADRLDVDSIMGDGQAQRDDYSRIF